MWPEIFFHGSALVLLISICLSLGVTFMIILFTEYEYNLTLSSSVLCSSGVKQTALAQCMRVLIIMYLAIMLWWLSQCTL